MNGIEPHSVYVWLRRLFALRPLALLLLLVASAFTEYRYNWVEQAVGAYLVTTNSRRPTLGPIWEKGRQTLTARQSLEQIINTRQASQREVRKADSLVHIASTISEDSGVMISAEHFRQLFLKLPSDVADEIISPFSLLQIAHRGQWDRTWIEAVDGGLKIYLLSLDNHVVDTISVPADLLDHLEKRDQTIPGPLENLPYFQDRIYPANLFFNSLNEFPEELKRGVIPQPERLFQIPGRIVRVGISDEAAFGYIVIGFEVESGGSKQVLLTRGHEWAVWRFHTRLEQELETLGDATDTSTSRFQP